VKALLWVVAAGNTGYGTQILDRCDERGCSDDQRPGNSDLAITVGSTHREMPHVYGVSYFLQGTLVTVVQADLVAPGEKYLMRNWQLEGRGAKKTCNATT
jgi:hypothetical protein